jgi:hypothetical protein
MNLIKLITLIAANKAKDAAEWVKGNLDLTLRLLYLSIGLPLVLTFAGLLIAGLSGNDAAVTLGRTLIIVSGVVSSVLLTLFWVRATVLVDMIVYATKGMNLVTDKVKSLDMEEAERFIRWLRGITTWLTVVWLYVMIFPVWRNLDVTAVVIVCIIFFSGVMSSRWFDGPWARRLVTLSVLTTFVFGTLWMVSPSFVRSIKDKVNSYVGNVAEKQERRESLNEVQTTAMRAATEQDKVLLLTLTERQKQLRRRAIELCGGKLCSVQEAKEYRQIEEDRRRINEGTYWQQQAVDEPVPPPSAVLPREEPAIGLSADLPPPVSPIRKKTATASQPRPASSQDDVFKELEKYPDL